MGPALTAVVITVVGWMTHRSVERAVKTNLAEQLSTLLNADVAALDFWLSGQRASSIALARDDRVQDPVIELLQLSRDSESDSVAADLLSSTQLRGLRKHLQPWLGTHHAQGFVIVDTNAMVIAGDVDFGIGDATIAKAFQPVLAPVFDGKTIVLPPLKSTLVLPDIDGTPRAGIPVMFVATPIRSGDEQVSAALCLRIRPEEEFTKIFARCACR